jgi:hypothetical protein
MGWKVRNKVKKGEEKRKEFKKKVMIQISKIQIRAKTLENTTHTTL